MALNSLSFADVPLSNYSLTQSPQPTPGASLPPKTNLSNRKGAVADG